MEIKSYRSLDRSVQFFGIKGRFLIPMGVGAALSLVAAMIAGKATNGRGGPLPHSLLLLRTRRGVPSGLHQR